MPPKAAAAKKGSKGKPAGKPAAKAGAAAAKTPSKEHVAAPPAPEPQPMGETVGLKQFQKFCFEDSSNALAQSGRWPLICDESERSMTFLRYRDVNMLNVMSASDMEVEHIRIAIIAGLRYGKPVVFDLAQTDAGATWPRVVEAVNAVKPDLMMSLLDKSILKEEYFLTLVKDSDGSEYGQFMFNPDVCKNFAFVVAAATPAFPADMTQKFFIVTIE